MLELHYDDVHIEKYRKMGKTGHKRRNSEFTIFNSVAQGHRRKLCQRIELPDSIKMI